MTAGLINSMRTFIRRPKNVVIFMAIQARILQLIQASLCIYFLALFKTTRSRIPSSLSTMYWHFYFAYLLELQGTMALIILWTKLCWDFQLGILLLPFALFWMKLILCEAFSVIVLPMKIPIKTPIEKGIQMRFL